EWDLINNLIYVDEVMSRLYGSERMTPEEAPKIIASSMHPGDYDETVRYMEDVFKDPTYLKLDIVYRIIWPDSSIHYIKSKGTIMRDETGRPFRLVGTNMDITLQKNAEEQLTKGYNTIRTFVESAPSAIAMFDTDLRYLAVSYQWIKDYRLNHYNLVGMLHYDVFPEVPQFWKEIHQACLKGETRESQGEQFLRADGSVQWIKYVVCPWYDAAGDIGGIIMNTSDITEQRAAVEELIKTKERLQLATEASKVGVWDWDIKNDLLYWDDQMYKLYGVDKAKEEDPEKILDAHVHPDDKQRVRAELKMALQGLMDVDTEFRVLWSNGMQRHIKAKAVVQRDAQDRAIRMVGTNLDITQLKVQLETLRQSEERYFKMVNEVQDYAIVLLDNRGKIENWNYGAEKIFEYTAVEIVGSSIEVFFTPEDINAQKVEQLFLASLETGRAQDEGWRVKKSGHLFLGNTTITALHGMQDEIIGFSMVIHDLTERKKAELTEKMEAKNKELEQITYIASHDLQEPLRTITGIVNIMNQQYVEQLDEDADKYLKFMKDASERMRNLIKGLLDYSRMGKGNEAIYFDSKEVLHEITQDLAVYIHESKAKITIVGNLPYIKAFKTEFRLLLQNLISNAIKFRNKGIDPEITIYANKENNSWKFGVKDNGIGIEPKYQEKIFMIFQRLHNRTEYEGTGIGLSHCKKIVELHGGRIWVDSYPGEGSTFYFTIPI
ncbi:MAG TPA: PAS domain S-box protein, partial [Cytophagales bacterium]|nr:PAS domain S-box protein [Cytophagales bacterium]